MKATAGRVVTYPPNVAGALSSPGPIARTVKDVALLMSSLTAPDERDVDQLPPYPTTKIGETLDEGVSELRIAVSATLGYAQNVHPEISDAVMKASSSPF
jgi:aspartyl-tRNA(Asn)/glutamyl-tRNA(Gln) amidotransferase subunit A